MNRTTTVRTIRNPLFGILLTGGLVVTSTPSALSTERSIAQWTKIEGIDTILAEKHDRPIVNLNLTFPSGSFSDPEGKEGSANLAGEMLLRGTRSHTREQIEEKLDYLGATLEVSVGYHSTSIDGQVLTRNLAPFLDLVMEVISESDFPEAELKKLKDETIAQLYLRLEDDAGLARMNFTKMLYAGHPYARDPMGTVASIGSVTRDDVAALAGASFRRGGLLVGAAGDLTKTDLAGIVRGLTSKLPEGTLPRVDRPFDTKLSGRRILLVDKPERTQTQFVIGQPGIDARDPDLFRLNVFLTAFAGHMFHATYMQEIRVKRGWSYGAYGSIDARRNGGSAYLYTFPKVTDTLPALTLSLDLFRKAIDGGVTDDQIDFAKKHVTRSFPFQIDTPEKVVGQRIMQRLLGRPDDYLEKYVSRMEAVTADDARAAAKKHLSTENVDIVILCTAKDFEKTIGAALGAKEVQVVPYDRM
ncbi:MAG: pitrilysin family protein [Pseudomonadota bacterium]